ncbi:MAG: helix-turn-helix domain-containing protein [Lachnospiraceae bacterium]|nr:helix-turn-helix domain-containing protein [Lachnospiraceae bacterium]
MEYSSKANAAIGSRIREVRRSANMTQEKLADLMGVSVNYLGEVERGRKPLSRSLANHFCSFFRVTYDYLYHGILPASWYEVHENASYQSVHTSLIEQLNGCSPQEILVISQLVKGYLGASRCLQSQEIPHDDADGQENSAP